MFVQREERGMKNCVSRSRSVYIRCVFMRSFCRTFDLHEIIPNLRDASKRARLQFSSGGFLFQDKRFRRARGESYIHANSMLMLITRSSSHTSELKTFLDADERSNSSIAILRHASCVTSPSIPIFSDFLHFLPPSPSSPPVSRWVYWLH